MTDRLENLDKVEELLQPPDIQEFIENHNTFSLLRERVAGRLERDIQMYNEEVEKQPSKLTYATTMLQIVNKYGWAVAWNLNSVMERVARND